MTCTIEGCTREVVARGWCSAHYTRWKRYGDPEGSAEPRPTPIARFILKVFRDPDSGCWIWTGTYCRKYGTFSEKHVLIPAHRWSYQYFVGPIPEGFEIDHLCRTPACVNPAHLEAVTGKENTRRHFAGLSHCKYGHEWTPENTFVGRDGRRRCRLCVNRRARESKARRRERWRDSVGQQDGYEAGLAHQMHCDEVFG